MSMIARIAKNTASLAAGNIITKFISLAFMIYVARQLGDLGFGQFSTAMALVGLVSVLPNYVARPFLIRETARARERAGQILDQVVLSNVVLALLVFGGLALLAPHLGYDAPTVKAIMILGFALIFDAVANSYHATLAGFERMEFSALVNVANTTMTVIFGGAVLLSGYGLIPLIWSYFAAKVLTVLLARRILRLLSVRTTIGFDPEMMRTMLWGARPFFVTSLFVMLYARLDIVMLSLLRDEVEAVGYYNAAYKLMEGMGLLSASFVAAVYPVLARMFVDEPDRLRRVYRRALRYLLAFVLPAAAGLTVVAPDLMPALFGDSFAPAAFALMILVWGQALDGLNPLLAQTLRAINRERTVAVITGVGATFNFVVNLILIPPYGLYGASAATVASFALVFVINRHVLKKSVGSTRLALPLLRTVLATAAMAGAMWLLAEYAIVDWSRGARAGVLIAAGIVVYALAAVVFGVLDKDDRAFLASLSQRRKNRVKGEQ
ncbi:MAG: flippase [Alphaproteobacteria bacterium]